MRLDDGKIGMSSVPGALLSVIIFIFLVLYMWMKIDIFINKKDADIMSVTNQSHYEDTEAFTKN